MTFYDVGRNRAVAPLVKEFASVQASAGQVLSNVQVKVHGYAGRIGKVAHAFLHAVDFSSRRYDVCTATNWEGRSPDEPQVLVAQSTRGVPHVIGAVVLDTRGVDMTVRTAEMQVGHGATKLYAQPEGSPLAEAQLAMAIKSPAVVGILAKMLTRPSLIDVDGERSHIKVYECEIGDHLLYAFGYSNKIKVGQTAQERAVLYEDRLEFYDESGRAVYEGEIQQILRNHLEEQPATPVLEV